MPFSLILSSAKTPFQKHPTHFWEGAPRRTARAALRGDPTPRVSPQQNPAGPGAAAPPLSAAWGRPARRHRRLHLGPVTAGRCFPLGKNFPAGLGPQGAAPPPPARRSPGSLPAALSAGAARRSHAPGALRTGGGAERSGGPALSGLPASPSAAARRGTSQPAAARLDAALGLVIARHFAVAAAVPGVPR